MSIHQAPAPAEAMFLPHDFVVEHRNLL